MARTNYSQEILMFLREHADDDPLRLILKKSPFLEIDNKELAAQIKGRQVAAKKFPFLLDYEHYQFPVNTSLEQASSELTAKYKASQVTGIKAVDLTGGMGLDTYFLSKQFDSVDYVEMNSMLCELAEYNFEVLGGANVSVVNSTAEDHLSTLVKQYDFAYIDPSRRIDGNKKTGINNLVPNVVELQTELLQLANEVMIKLSPMQDITEVVNVLKQVSSIEVVAVGDDVKELLVVLKRNYNESPVVRVASLQRSKSPVSYTSCFSDVNIPVTYREVKKYIYQPHPVLVKSGLQNRHAVDIGLSKLNPNTQLYTSDELVEDYFGRVFIVKATLPINKKAVSKYLPQGKANIISKNHPLSPSQIAKKLSIKDGGDDYLIAATLYDGSKGLFLCERLR